MCNKMRAYVIENYKDCLFNDKILLKSQQRFKSDHHKVYTEEVNKIALQTSDGTETYPYRTNAFKVCKSEMMVVIDFFC